MVHIWRESFNGAIESESERDVSVGNEMTAWSSHLSNWVRWNQGSYNSVDRFWYVYKSWMDFLTKAWGADLKSSQWFGAWNEAGKVRVWARQWTSWSKLQLIMLLSTAAAMIMAIKKRMLFWRFRVGKVMNWAPLRRYIRTFWKWVLNLCTQLWELFSVREWRLWSTAVGK